MVDPATQGVAHGVASLVKPQGDFAAAARQLLNEIPEVTIGVTDREINPHLVVLHGGQTIRFPGDQWRGHDFHALTPVGLPMIDTSEAGAARWTRVIRSGPERPTPIACTVHPWMRGQILAVDHPFAIATKVDGSFELTGVPAGEQHLIVWHETEGWLTPGGKNGMAVQVPAGGVGDVGAIRPGTPAQP